MFLALPEFQGSRRRQVLLGSPVDHPFPGRPGSRRLRVRPLIQGRLDVLEDLGRQGSRRLLGSLDLPEMCRVKIKY